MHKLDALQCVPQMHSQHVRKKKISQHVKSAQCNATQSYPPRTQVPLNSFSVNAQHKRAPHNTQHPTPCYTVFVPKAAPILRCTRYARRTALTKKRKKCQSFVMCITHLRAPQIGRGNNRPFWYEYGNARESAALGKPAHTYFSGLDV